MNLLDFPPLPELPDEWREVIHFNPSETLGSAYTPARLIVSGYFYIERIEIFLDTSTSPGVLIWSDTISALGKSKIYTGNNVFYGVQTYVSASCANQPCVTYPVFQAVENADINIATQVGLTSCVISVIGWRIPRDFDPPTWKVKTTEISISNGSTQLTTIAGNNFIHSFLYYPNGWTTFPTASIQLTRPKVFPIPAIRVFLQPGSSASMPMFQLRVGEFVRDCEIAVAASTDDILRASLVTIYYPAGIL